MRYDRMTAVLALIGLNCSAAWGQPEATPDPAPPADPAIQRALGPTGAQIGSEVESLLNRRLEIVGARARVLDGVVILEGTVRSEADRLRASDLAREVGGVERVDNALTVDSTAANNPPGELARSGGSLEAVVAARLRGDPVLGAREIRVTASPGTNTVTLLGVVLSQSEKERAGRIAAEAFAAGHVRNELLVRSD